MSRSRLSDGDRERLYKRLDEAHQNFEARHGIQITVRAQRWGAKDDLTYTLDVLTLDHNVFTQEFSSRAAALRRAAGVADALADRLVAIDERPPPESEGAE